MVSPRKSSHPKELNSHPIGSVYGICIYIYIFLNIHKFTCLYLYRILYHFWNWSCANARRNIPKSEFTWTHGTLCQLYLFRSCCKMKRIHISWFHDLIRSSFSMERLKKIHQLPSTHITKSYIITTSFTKSYIITTSFLQRRKDVRQTNQLSMGMFDYQSANYFAWDLSFGLQQ